MGLAHATAARLAASSNIQTGTTAHSFVLAFELDVLACPRCASRLKLIACITQPAAIRAILRHLLLPADAPDPQPARAPPWAQAADGVYDDDAYDRQAADAHDAIDDDPDRAA